MVNRAHLKKTNPSNLAGLGLVLLLMFAVIMSFSTKSVLAYSGGSTIQATICDNQPPLLNIVSPVEGQTVDTPEINLSGTTERTTQISISINGTYSQSVAVGLDQTFDTQIPLEKGVNNITLDSYFSCNHTNSSDSLTVTYKPAPTPVTPPNNNQPGTSSNNGSGLVYISRPTIFNGDNSQISKLPAKTNKPSNPIKRIKNNLGFNNHSANIKDSLVTPLASWTSLVIATLALMFAFMPSITTVWFKKLFKIHIQSIFPWHLSINLLRLIAFVIAIILLFFVQL